MSKEELQNLTEFYITQINAYTLRENQPRRKKIAKEKFGSEASEHLGIRNREFEIVAKKDSRRPYLIRPTTDPIPVIPEANRTNP